MLAPRPAVWEPEVKPDLYMFQVYSMLSMQERYRLYLAAKEISLNPNVILLEFGVFFGGSLEALSLGLSENPNGGKIGRGRIIGVDAFECLAAGTFHGIVLERAGIAGYPEKLQFNEGMVNWKSLVHENLKGRINVELVKAAASAYRHDGSSIALVHLDLPKYFREMETILVAIVESLKPGGLVVFQDFFYHWSAEIIAFIFYVLERGGFEPLYLQDSTFAMKNTGLNVELINGFSRELADADSIVNILLRLVQYVDKAVTDTQRASLCLAVYQFARGNRIFSVAQDMERHLNLQNPTVHVADALKEMEGYDFNLKKLYSLEY
jgi:hypothetical protein